MGHFMRQQAGCQDPHIIVNHSALAHAVVAGLMVLQAKMGNPVAEGHQEMVFAVMPGPKESASLGHQVFVFVHGLLRPLQSSVAIGGDFEKVLDRALRRKWNMAEMPAGEYRGINQRSQRDGMEVDLSVGFAVYWQSCSIMPAGGN